ncbi:MAG TPA: SDR family NAD(P)-dependent oxidoreductase [Actinobacteria bacterium]|nr:SDR family NAD(P)-dependent oxidoreductase [Actinomycetota bacterium]
MAYTTSSIPEQTGKVAIVTGANGGLGLEIAKGLAGAGAHVVMAARNQDKAKSAHNEILTAHPDAQLEITELDLGSLASVERAATSIASNYPAVDILVNNAGVMALPERKTADGFEMQFGVNHLGHWALTSRLLPNLLEAPAARVVAQSSMARLTATKINIDNPHLIGEYAPWKAYNQSKLANYVFALGLQQRFEDAGVNAMSLVAHPGLTNSDLQNTTQDHGGAGFLGWFSQKWAKTSGMSPAKGALPALRAATDPNATGGTLYGPRFNTFGTAVRRPTLRPGMRKMTAGLWEISARETGLEVAPTS